MAGVVLLILWTACGAEAPAPPPKASTPPPAAPAPPSKDEAQSIVSTAPEFSDYQFTRAAYSLPMSRAAMNEPAREAAASLRKAGWISFSGDRVVLTGKAAADKRFLVRQNDVVDLVPLARKEFIGVTAVRTDSDGAPLVDFEWKWVPNEIGRLFGTKYEGTQRATAKLLRDGSAWTVLRIEEFHAPQPG